MMKDFKYPLEEMKKIVLVIKRLLDRTSQDDSNSENKKNWYDFDKLENDR